MVEMLTKKPLWPTLEDVPTICQVTQNAKPQYNLDSSVSKSAKQFLDDVLVYDQYQRPSAEQLLNHPWFTGIYSGEIFIESKATEYKTFKFFRQLCIP